MVPIILLQQRHEVYNVRVISVKLVPRPIEAQYQCSSSVFVGLRDVLLRGVGVDSQSSSWGTLR